MKKFLQYGWLFPILTIVCYISIYFYKLSYFKTFDIPAQLMNISIEDFFVPGLVVFGFFVMFFFGLKAKYVEKPSFELLDIIESGKPVHIFFIILIFFGVPCLVLNNELVYILFFVCIILFFCFSFRFFVIKSLNAECYTNIILAAIFAVLTSWLLGLYISTKKDTFLSTYYSKTQIYLLIDKNSQTTGIFKLYNKTTHTLEKGVYILDLTNKPIKYYKIDKTREQISRAAISQTIKQSFRK